MKRLTKRQAVAVIILLTLLSIQGIKNAEYRRVGEIFIEYDKGNAEFHEVVEAVIAYNTAWNE